MPVRELPHRYREIGRLRLGLKNARGLPERSSTWRLTTHNQLAAVRAASLWGGTVEPWTDAPTEGDQWEVLTEASEIPVMIPPQDVREGQFYELWSGGGIQRRCDGVVEYSNGEHCLCDPDNRECDLSTTLLVLLPDLPDLGAWRLVTKGFYAATEIPQTVDMLQGVVGPGRLPSALLAIEGRTRKVDGKTMHFPVPVLRTTATVAELRAGQLPELPGSLDPASVPGSADVAAVGEPGQLSDPGNAGAPTGPGSDATPAEVTTAPGADTDAAAAGTGDVTTTPEPAAPAEQTSMVVEVPKHTHLWFQSPTMNDRAFCAFATPDDGPTCMASELVTALKRKGRPIAATRADAVAGVWS